MMKNTIITVNYILGFLGILIISIGYIVTTGGLNTMSINEKYGINPPDLFSTPVNVILLVLLPALLIRGTLGKYIKFFNFSAKFLVFLIAFTAITSFVADMGETYNYFMYVDEDITKSYKDIDISYKKKIDLTTKVEMVFYEYMDYEKTTLQNIALARSGYFNARDVNEKVSAANSFDQNLKTLMVTVENYPELKANENIKQYIKLIIDLENEIQQQKGIYNQKVNSYNINIRSFPTVIVARIFGLETKAYFDEVSTNVQGIFDVQNSR